MDNSVLRDMWFVIADEGGQEQPCESLTEARTALSGLDGSGRIERHMARTAGRTIVAVSDDHGTVTTLAMACDRIENGLPVRYASTEDGDRYACIDPVAFDMSGWRIEVGPDSGYDPSFGDWKYEQPEYARRTHIEEFTTDDGFGFGFKPWSAMVDWGRKIVRWIPPGEE
jgi:hypothetical protein